MNIIARMKKIREWIVNHEILVVIIVIIKISLLLFFIK